MIHVCVFTAGERQRVAGAAEVVSPAVQTHLPGPAAGCAREVQQPQQTVPRLPKAPQHVFRSQAGSKGEDSSLCSLNVKEKMLYICDAFKPIFFLGSSFFAFSFFSPLSCLLYCKKCIE